MRGRTVAALGFRAHTGWAAVIAVTKECEVLERRRIAFEPPSTRFVYHKAAEIPLEQAETMIAAACAEVTAAAERQIKILIAALAERRIAVRAACVPAGNSKLPNVLADILAAHSRIHAAEGVFYREALVEACVRLRLRVVRAPERDLWPLSAKALVSTEVKLRTRLREMGKRLGPPWGEDQKVAALAACVAFTVPKAAAVTQH
jgi:hypothetical protein